MAHRAHRAHHEVDSTKTMAWPFSLFFNVLISTTQDARNEDREWTSDHEKDIDQFVVGRHYFRFLIFRTGIDYVF